MRGLRWAEILIASLVVSSGSLIYSAMAAGSSHGGTLTETASYYQSLMTKMGFGVGGLILALVLGLVCAFFPGWLGRKQSCRARIETVFIASPEGHILFRAHPEEMPGELRARLTIDGQTEEYACRKEAYLRMRQVSSGIAVIAGGLVLSFEPSS